MGFDRNNLRGKKKKDKGQRLRNKRKRNKKRANKKRSKAGAAIKASNPRPAQPFYLPCGCGEGASSHTAVKDKQLVTERQQ